jgi:hypothetical protein
MAESDYDEAIRLLADVRPMLGLETNSEVLLQLLRSCNG